MHFTFKPRPLALSVGKVGEHIVQSRLTHTIVMGGGGQYHMITVIFWTTQIWIASFSCLAINWLHGREG